MNPQPTTSTAAATAEQRSAQAGWAARHATEYAAHTLITALEARQLRPNRDHRPWPGTAVVVTIGSRTPFTLADVEVARSATPDQARRLEHALSDAGIGATVVPDIPFGWLHIACTSADDALRLADLVWREMPRAHQVAYRLRTVLSEAGGHDRPLETVEPQVIDGGIEIGALTVPQAVLLLRLLGGQKTFSYSGWQRLDTLRTRLRDRLVRLLPGVAVTATPACGTCSQDSEITIGPAPVDHITALADLLQAALPPTKRQRITAALPPPRAHP
jgi:hypothetical protein